MTVLALDLSKHTGWAVDSDIPGRPLSGVWDLPGSAEESGVAGMELAKQLNARIVVNRPSLIVYEKPLDPRNLGDSPEQAAQRFARGQPARKKFMANFETIRLLIGLTMVVELAALRHEIEVQEAYVQSWRSYFTGTQKGGKEPTKARCVQLRWPFKNDNQSDAMGIWAFAKATTDPQWRPTPG